jgi:lysozyme
MLVVFSAQHSGKINFSQTSDGSNQPSLITSLLDGVTAGETALVQAFQQNTNQIAVDMIKQRVGLRQEAYDGPSGEILIGYGHSDGVTPGMTVTAEQAETFLRQDLVAIERTLRARVQTPVNENEFSAMVVLAYNIGVDQFANSSVLRELNQDNRTAAANAFLMWNKSRRDGELIENTYLTSLRTKERELFLTPTN